MASQELLEKLLEKQDHCFENIKQLATNFKKDSASRKTLDYLEKRLDTLEAFWDEFRSNHEVLMKNEYQEDEYFKKNVFTSTQTIYESLKHDLLTLKRKLTTEDEPSRQDSNQDADDSENLSVDTKKLLRQQHLNFNSFERIISKISIDEITEKWELEDNLTNIKHKWEAIDKIHWELDYELSGAQWNRNKQEYSTWEAKYESLKRSLNQKIWSSAHYNKTTPKVDIPEFNGDYNQWVSFRDLFTETIDRNPLLSKSQKMQYLKTELKGEAEKLVQHLNISAEIYSAWKIIEHRYENKRLLFSSYMNALLNLKPIEQPSAKNLKKLHDTLLECLNGLHNLGIHIDTWDPLIVHLLLPKLDATTYAEYIHDLENPRELPNLQEFAEFEGYRSSNLGDIKVTHITAFPQKENHPNIRQIDVSSFQKMEGVSQVANITAIMENGNFQDQSLSSIFDLLTSIGRSTYLHENVQKLMNDPNEHFDVVIIEYMMSEIGVGLSSVFGCPFIHSWSIDPHSLALSLVDEPLSPAYSPGLLSARVPPFSFADRIKELFSAALLMAYREYYAWTTEEQNYNEIFEPIVSKKGRKLPAFAEARYSAALMLGNSHASLGGAARLPQSYVPVAGYHIGEPAPLPTDLQKIMDNAKNGVIYFSMGSNLKSKYLPEAMKRDLLKVFAARKETVIWKFEEDLPDLPKNVYILNWAPQHSILAHPNCKLFITHGGLLSLTEAIHFGVPLVGIPVFGDQFLNVQRAAQRGYAVHAPLTHTLPQTLRAAIEEVLGHSKYAEKAKELSLIYHDRPCSAAAAARHAVELAVRTRGAAHLRSPALLLPWYQKCYLDFAALLIAILLTVSLVIKRICRLCFSNKKSSNPKIKNN